MNKPMPPPRFRLFRLTKPMDNGYTHAGEVWIHGKMWTITARVIETPHGRQFSGDVEAPGEAIAKKLRQSTTQGDLVSQAAVSVPEALPFNDPLPDKPF